jgi:hypothetical protein
VADLDLIGPARAHAYRALGLEPPPVPLLGAGVHQPGGAADALRQVVEQHGLAARHYLEEGNASYSFTDPFDIGSGRVAVLAVVDDGTTQVLRVFYRSNSQSSFRLLPAYNDRIPVLNPPVFDKGGGEHLLAIPARLDQALARLVAQDRTRTDIPDAEQNVLMAAVPVSRTLEDYGARPQHPDYPAQQIGSEGLLTPPVPPRLLELIGSDRTKLDPRDVVVPPEKMPDFSAPVMTYPTRTGAAGPLTAMVYRSADGTLEYTLVRDAAGRVWIGSVQRADAPITSLGVRSTALEVGDLASPALEYLEGIPEKIELRHVGGPYYDLWPYVRQIPLIRAYYEQNGLPIPD